MEQYSLFKKNNKRQIAMAQAYEMLLSWAVFTLLQLA